MNLLKEAQRILKVVDKVLKDLKKEREALDETEHLLQGKNGEKLKESIKQIKKEKHPIFDDPTLGVVPFNPTSEELEGMKKAMLKKVKHFPNK